MKPVAKTRLLGLCSRRERWGLSRRGWLVLVVGFILGGLFSIFNVQPFLAPTKRVDAKILVVEGWIPSYALRAAAVEFRAGRYEKIYTTGGPIAGASVTNIYNTVANVAGDSLLALGIPAESLQVVPAQAVGRDRTYTSALALRDWLRDRNLKVAAINVVSADVHARRTWLLFQRAFGDEVSVGIIAMPDPDYEPKRWWRYSEGVREILGESIAYAYAKFIFKPEKSGKQVP
jgi:uncharacterized SAM-binding protein YcdF (DUF218 family)